MADITYRFVASGADDIVKAFSSIEARAKASKKATDDAGRSAARGGAGAGAGGGGRAGGSQAARLAARVAADQERAAKRETSIAERAAIAKMRAQERAQRHVAKIRDKHFADTQRAEERHASESAKRSEKAARDHVRRSTRAAQQAAKQEANAKKRAQEEAAESRSKTIGRLADASMGAAIGLGITGAAAAGAAARESLALDEASRRIAINARKSGGELLDPTKLRQSFEATALATPGTKAADVADAVARFVSLTGDVDTALKSQGTFATVASASGANVGDVAEAAASLSQQFDIKGIEDMRNALAALTFQGKEGSFELKDAAAQFQRLAASGAAFGIPKGVGGVKILGGLTQIARSGTGSSEQAATAVENLLTNLKVKQKMLGAAGVDVFDKAGNARDVTDVIVDSISKVGGGDMAKKSMGLSQIFGEQGIRAINPLVAKYSDTYRNTQGTEAEKTAAAVKVLRAELERSINAPGTWSDVVQDSAYAQKDASAQMTQAWEALKAGVSDIAVPAIMGLAESVKPLVDSLKKDFAEATPNNRVGGKAAADAAAATVKELSGKANRTQAEDDQLRAAQETVDQFKHKQDRSALFQKLTAAGAGPDELKAYGFDTGGGPMSFEEYIRRDADQALAGESDPALVEAQLAKSREKAHALAAQGFAPSGVQDILLGAGETDQQTIDRNRFQRGMGGEGVVDVGKNAAAPVTTEEINKALAAAATAANAAAAAMQKMASANQGNILGP